MTAAFSKINKFNLSERLPSHFDAQREGEARPAELFFSPSLFRESERHLLVLHKQTVSVQRGRGRAVTMTSEH